MYMPRKRARTLEQERRKKQVEMIALGIVLLVTLFLMFMALQAG